MQKAPEKRYLFNEPSPTTPRQSDAKITDDGVETANSQSGNIKSREAPHRAETADARNSLAETTPVNQGAFHGATKSKQEEHERHTANSEKITIRKLGIATQ